MLMVLFVPLEHGVANAYLDHLKRNPRLHLVLVFLENLLHTFKRFVVAPGVEVLGRVVGKHESKLGGGEPVAIELHLELPVAVVLLGNDEAPHEDVHKAQDGLNC